MGYLVFLTLNTLHRYLEGDHTTRQMFYGLNCLFPNCSAHSMLFVCRIPEQEGETRQVTPGPAYLLSDSIELLFWASLFILLAFNSCSHLAGTLARGECAMGRTFHC